MSADKAFSLEDIPHARLVYALGALLLQGFTNHPGALHNVILEGEQRFVDACLITDKYGMSRADYKRIYKRLARAATRMGLTATIQ